MDFENVSITDIKKLLTDAFEAQFNKRFRLLPKSFLRVFSSVLAGVYITLFKNGSWFFLQMFPSTAYYGEIEILGKKINPLEMLGNLFGIGNPRDGTQWKGTITITVKKQNSILNQGTQLKSDITGKLYLTEETKLLNAAKVEITITCAETGTSGNLAESDVLNFVQPLGFVETAAIVTRIEKNATEEESESDYRFRIENRFQIQPNGGSFADYRLWGLEVNGVLQVYPYKDPDSATGVLLYVSGNTNVLHPTRIPDNSLLIAVGKSVSANPETSEARKPIGAVIDPSGDETFKNIKKVSATPFDVFITGSTVESAHFIQATKDSVKNYFLTREPFIRGIDDETNKKNTVTKNNVSSIIDQIIMNYQGSYDDITIKNTHAAVVTNYVLGFGELAYLNKIYINGTER